ncbi:hypothetical protein AB0O28_34400 [Microbispora sp. NPDC088329]|uniref:hypothetical protein n=1 Tax=Microbispora sp. NPDC088329 TaxID=3154869 RepID=UPI00341A0DB8
MSRLAAAMVLLVAAVLVALPAPPAWAAELCSLRFVIGTGDDGIRDDSLEIIRLGEKAFLFTERPLYAPIRPYHQGGTGDRAHTEHRWTGHLRTCATSADLADGFSIEHVNYADDCCTDNWYLKYVRIEDPVSGSVLAELTAPPGREYVHYFQKNAGQILRIPVDGEHPPDPPADPARTFCRMEFTIGVGTYGLRNDSLEIIRLGDLVFLFEERPAYAPPRPYHQGNTSDQPDAEYTWRAHLAGCATAADLANGFTIEHINYADDCCTDNWSLRSLRIRDLDTGRVLLDHAAPPGKDLHLFQKNADQFYTTLDHDSDGDGLSDRIELHGIRDQGVVDTWLPDHGSDPCRETIAVEIDWLHDTVNDVSDMPDRAAIDEAIAMFANAPRGPQDFCPYGHLPTAGVQLLVDLDEGIPVDQAERMRPLLQAPHQVLPYYEFADAHFSAVRRGLFRYNLWGYRADDTNRSGSCCTKWGFVVTLGTMQDPPVRVQSASFVHELGHALGLAHGGHDHVNYKPNYLSVMNYAYSSIGIPDYVAWDRRREQLGPAIGRNALEQTLQEVSTIDYSRSTLWPLRRWRLDEGRNGLGTGQHAMATWWDNKGVRHVGDASDPIDWHPEDDGVVKVDVNGEFQLCIEAADGSLESRRANDDSVQGGKIYAGLDGVCDSSPALTDRAVVPQGFDYPQEHKYKIDDGVLLGSNDWSRIRIAPGSGDGLPAPGDVPEMTTDEIMAHRARFLDAVVAADSPKPVTAPRWGYAYMDRATPAEAPLGTVTPLTTSGQWSTGRLDPATANRRATVVHTGTGTYDVRLPGVASPGGIAHVTPYRTAYRGRTCGVTGYAPDGPDQLVQVRCFNENGAPADWWFTVFFAEFGPGTTPYATIRYDDTAGGVHTLNPVLNTGTVNSGGGVNRVVRESVGRYQVTLDGRAFADGTGYVQVTPYGNGTPARCNPATTQPGDDRLEITVVCHAISGGAPADSPWLLSYTQDAGLHRDVTTPAAYVTVTGDVDPARSYSSTGETPALTRLGTGNYRLTWENLGKVGDSIQVTSTGTGGGYCHLGNVNSYAAAPRVTVDVWCHTAAGTPGDSSFALAYLRVP